MSKITTRPEFVAMRNAFFDELQRRPAQMARDRMAANPATRSLIDGTVSMIRGQEDDAMEQMRRDYKELCRISAIPCPPQDDFNIAEEIGRRHGVWA